MFFNRSLKEALGYEPSLFHMGIAYEIVSYDEDTYSRAKRKGWVLPFEERDIEEIDAYATKYEIPPRRDGDSRRDWETDEGSKDNMTGDETYYILVVKNLDGSDIGQEQFDEINDRLKDQDEEMGISVNPRPMSV